MTDTNLRRPHNTASESSQAWWQQPFRMFQTNLREIDALMDVDAALTYIENHGANAWLVNGGGICSFYPTDLPFQTRNLYLEQRPSGDLLGDVVNAARSRGLRVLARMDFSKVARHVAMDHPEWLFVDPAGESQVYQGLYSVCPSAGYYQHKVFEIIDDVVERYGVDGFFFNWFSYNEMDYSYRYRGVCQCRECRRRFASHSGGGELPIGPESDNYDTWRTFTAGVLHELTTAFRARVAAKSPDAALILGRAADVMFHEANNAVGRELWPSATAEAVSAFKTRSAAIPVLVNAVSFVDMPWRLASEEPEHFAQYLIQAIARGANPSTYVMGAPQDIRYAMLEVAGEITRFHRDNEDVYTGLEPCASIALVRANRLGVPSAEVQARTDEFRGLYLALREASIPFDVLAEEDLAELRGDGRLDRFAAIVLPDVTTDDQTCSALDAWVTGGGVLIATGAVSAEEDGAVTVQALPAQRLVATVTDHEALKNSYVAAVDQQEDVAVRQSTGVVPVMGALHYYDWEADATRHGHFIAQGPFGPPEKTYGNRVTRHPAWAIRRQGQGAGVQIPWSLGRAYMETGLSSIRHAFLDVVRETVPRADIEVDADEQVEVILGRSGGRLVVHLINLSGAKRRNFGPPVPVDDCCIRLRGAVRTAVARVAGIELETELIIGPDGDHTVIRLPRLIRHEVIVVGVDADPNEGEPT